MNDAIMAETQEMAERGLEGTLNTIVLLAAQRSPKGRLDEVGMSHACKEPGLSK